MVLFPIIDYRDADGIPWHELVIAPYNLQS
jgi:hypothetical protein